MRRYKHAFFQLSAPERRRVFDLCPDMQEESCSVSKCSNGQFYMHTASLGVGESDRASQSHPVSMLYMLIVALTDPLISNF